MKEINVLIAVFAVLAAVSSAKAEEIKVDFDGKKGTQAQSVSRLFAAGASLPQADSLPAPKMVPAGDDPCCDNPFINCYAPCEPEQGRSAASPDLKTLARFYLAQRDIKTLVAGHYLSKGDKAAAAALQDEAVRVGAGDGFVAVVRGGSQERIADRALAAKVLKLAKVPGADQQQSGNKILFYYGAAAAIGCMTDDACWGAVGDAVSAVSEWANS